MIQQTQGDPYAAFIKVVRRTGINTSKQGNGEDQINQKAMVRAGGEKQGPVTI